MLKAVLLIGPNQYESGLDRRQVVVQEAEAIRRLLRHPILKGLSTHSMRTLKDPSRQGLTDSIGQLFSDRSRDQLLILLFSDTALKDPSGSPTSPYGTTRKTGYETEHKNNRTVSSALAIAASVVHTLIDHCLPNPQHTHPGKEGSSVSAKVTAMDPVPLDVRTQLDGESWIIITSSPPSVVPLNQTADTPHPPQQASPLWRRSAMILGVSAFAMVTLALGSSYALLQTQENTRAKASLEKAQALQAKSGLRGLCRCRPRHSTKRQYLPRRPESPEDL